MTHPALLLIESIAAKHARLELEPIKLARLRALQRWQIQRLQRTYEDLRAMPRYRDSIEFFVHDLYGPHDYAQRDHDLYRVLEPWQHILPARALQAVTSALELEALTQQLDLDVLDKLDDRTLDSASYAFAYRAAGRRSDRQRQIRLIVDCGRALDALVANPWIRRALRLATIPARLAGIMALHEFLERGYEAFAKMNGAHEFLERIEQRETLIMNNLFAGCANPFVAQATQSRAIHSPT